VVNYLFHTLKSGARPPVTTSISHIFLQPDNWDDFHYRTTFTLWIADPKTGLAVDVGTTKIASDDLVALDRDPVFVDLPRTFRRLESTYFSVGQDRDFYTRLRDTVGLENARQVLGVLNDLALNPGSIKPTLEKSDAARTSLFRSVSPQTVADQFSRILRGGVDKERFSLAYVPSAVQDPATGKRPIMDFGVHPTGFLPTNTHVIIGANGVGKTTAIRRIRESLRKQRHDNIADGFVEIDDAERVSSLLTVSFSAFDSAPPGIDLDRADFRIVDVAMTGATGSQRLLGDEEADLRSPDGQGRRFRENVGACLLDRRKRLRQAMRLLSRADTTLAGYFLDDVDELAELPFKDMSSGHKVVLLAVTTLVRYCEERTLVLIDEPEAHLHPPLLSAFVRIISELVADRNGLAIIATHSPIVLQEVPRSCAWVIWRQDPVVRVFHPKINTFGESVDVLTREVFALELREAGYYTLLEQAASKHSTYTEAVNAFGGELGSDARLVLRALMAEKGEGQW
jgi:predicted ATPase